jgi:hypothetical protein
VFPLPNLNTKAVELLDSENYLLPQIPPASRCEYLQPLPDWWPFISPTVLSSLKMFSGPHYS